MSNAANRLLAAACLAAAAVLCRWSGAHASGPGDALGLAMPGHEWGYPFCGAQPVITGVFDHEHPTYGDPPNADPSTGRRNGTIRLYNDTVQNHRAYDGHNGWDYRTRRDGRNVKQPVLAVADGTVLHAGWHYEGQTGCGSADLEHDRGLGLVVAIRHGGRSSLYGHLSAVSVVPGEQVARGQQIGASGATGNAAGPHLHFGAFAPDPYDLWHATDPYGWNRDWQGVAELPMPPETDPWFRAGGPQSVRLLLPGAADNAPCPAPCKGSDPVVVDDRDPGFRLGCAHPPCSRWFALPAGYRGHAWIAEADRSGDHWAEWASGAGAGTYQVAVHVPLAAHHAGAHAARFEVAGRVVVVDQHAEGNVWVDIGTYAFRASPRVRLSSESWIGGWRDDGTCGRVTADAVRFTPICGGSVEPG